MKERLFTGCATALVTPFDEDGRIDFDTLGVLIDRQIQGGVDALVACGTTGESATLSDLEFDQIIRFCNQRIHGRVPLIAGVGKNDTRHSVELARSAARLGADGLLAVTPYYNKTSQAGLVAHFTALADSAGLPLLLYNVPARTGMSITAETYAVLAQNPYIVGTKEAGGDMGLVLDTRRCCPEDFAIYSGNDDQILPILALGGAGVISTVSNLVPQAVSALCAAWQAGDLSEARQSQIHLAPLIRAIFCEVNPIPLKAALHIMGYDSGTLRPPLVPLDEAGREALKEKLLASGLI